MNRKKIGIVGWNTGENSFGVTKPYAELIKNFGDMHILAPSNSIREDLDLLILPGGMDISSYIYGKVPSYYNTNADLMKEFFFVNNLGKYIDKGTPIFGICLGMQQLSVHFGAKMIQNGGFEYSVKSRSELVNELVFAPEFSYLSEKTVKGKPVKTVVNSLHNQAVDEESLPDCLQVVARCKEEGNIEIIKHKELPIWGVQYHPEEIYDSPAINILFDLLKKHERATV